MAIKFDFSEVARLAADLGAAPGKAAPNIAKAIQVTAHHVKSDWADDWSGSSHVPGGAASITYDMTGPFSAEIGPELRGQGPIAGMLEYGTPNTGARGFGAAALHKNEPDFVKGIELAAGDIL
jgi:hypothetical protein